MYIHPASGRTFADHSAIRAGMTNVLFCDIISESDLAYHGLCAVMPTSPAVAVGQVADSAPPVLVDGVWTQAWTIRDATAGELAAQVPQQVTRRQARRALLLAGLIDSVEPAIAAIPDATQRRLAQIDWEDSQTFERQRPLVIEIGAALNLDSAGLDDLFIMAASL